MRNPQNVLVTGATGFLGRHVLENLRNRYPETKIIVLLRDPNSWKAMDWTLHFRDVEFVKGDVVGKQDWIADPKLKNLDSVLHLAAVVQHSRKNSEPVYHTNIEGTLNMVRLGAQKGARVVFVSTSGTVGCFKNPATRPDEEAAYCEPEVARWPYYDSKIKAEKAARKLAEELATDLVIVRPPVLLGPGDHRFRSTGHVIRALRGKLPFLVKGGIHFVDIRDAANAIVNVLAKNQPKPVYHLFGTECEINEFFQMIEDLSGAKKPGLLFPAFVAKMLSIVTTSLEVLRPGKKLALLPDPVVMEMASRYWGLSSKYSGQDLGYSPRDGRVTLADTIAWLRRHHPDLKDAQRDDYLEVSVKAPLPR